VTTVSATTRRTPATLLCEPEFLAIATIKFASGVSFATILLALALYADEFAVSGGVAGLFGTAYAVVRLLLVLPVGRYIDLGDVKQYLVAGVLLHAAVLVGYTFVATAWHVIVLRVFQSAGATILIVGGTAVVGEIAPESERGLWIGTHNQIGSAASLTGDLVGGVLLYSAGFAPTYIVLVCLHVLAALVASAVLREEPGGRADPEAGTGADQYRKLLGRSAVRALVLFRFAFSFGKMAVILFLPIFARLEFGLNAALIGGILAGGKITKSLAQGYVGSLTDRIGHEAWFIVAGTLGYALGTALLPFATDSSAVLPPVVIDVPPLLQSSLLDGPVILGPAVVLLFGAYAILGIADSLRLPTSMALFVEEGEHYDAVSSSLSLRSLSWQVGAVVGPLAVGVVSDLFSYYQAFWLASATMVLAAAVFAWLYTTEPAPGTTPRTDTGD
jgi:MFS family permease